MLERGVALTTRTQSQPKDTAPFELEHLVLVSPVVGQLEFSLRHEQMSSEEAHADGMLVHDPSSQASDWVL
ncbi:MAG: hypothetical protein JWP97_5424 [Labilithrix sp.]|nr:hypothetical protein [Labilithrix sp.]